MSSEPVVLIDRLSKSYHIYEQPRDRLIQMVLPRVQRALGRTPRSYFREFWALHDVSLTVKRGETIGVIGRNGSGKSTLLQIVAGTLAATTGGVHVQGRVAALLELGSGFSPDFTGRENVYTNAAVLGLTHEEIEARFDTITAFADIGDFIDQPVKTYSSGMVLRLAFAVQAQVDPDVLIVDEALAVGDAKFQVRCFDRLKQMKAAGTSVLLVTHSTEQIVTHCDRAVLLDHGRIQADGPPRDVANQYLDRLFGRERVANPGGARSSPTTVPPTTAATHPAAALDLTSDVFETRHGYNRLEYRWGDGAATILDFVLCANGGPAPASLAVGDLVELYVALRFERALACPILGVVLKTKEGVTICGTNSEMLDTDGFRQMGDAGQTRVVKVAFTCRLASGDYFISLGLATRQGETVVPHDRRYDAIHVQVAPEPTFFGIADMGMTLQVEPRS